MLSCIITKYVCNLPYFIITPRCLFQDGGDGQSCLMWAYERGFDDILSLLKRKLRSEDSSSEGSGSGVFFVRLFVNLFVYKLVSLFVCFLLVFCLFVLCLCVCLFELIIFFVYIFLKRRWCYGEQSLRYPNFEFEYFVKLRLFIFHSIKCIFWLPWLKRF